MESLRKILLDLLLNSIHVSVACSTRRLAWSTGLLPPSRLHLFFIFSLFSLFFLDAIVKKLFLHFTSSSFKVAKVSFSTRFHYFFLWVDDIKIKRSKKYFENEKEIDKKRKRGIRSFNKNVEYRVDLESTRCCFAPGGDWIRRLILLLPVLVVVFLLAPPFFLSSPLSSLFCLFSTFFSQLFFLDAISRFLFFILFLHKFFHHHSSSNFRF